MPTNKTEYQREYMKGYRKRQSYKRYQREYQRDLRAMRDFDDPLYTINDDFVIYRSDESITGYVAQRKEPSDFWCEVKAKCSGIPNPYAVRQSVLLSLDGEHADAILDPKTGIASGFENAVACAEFLKRAIAQDILAEVKLPDFMTKFDRRWLASYLGDGKMDAKNDLYGQTRPDMNGWRIIL